jgi:predicted aspartyl protease
MIKGFFRWNTPIIKVSVGLGQIMRAPFVILDTGFTGYLQITSKMATELGIKQSGVLPVRIPTGQIIEFPTALAFADMEGEKKVVEVLIADGLPLAGVSLLSKFSYKAEIDCKNKTVELEKVA